MENKKPKALGGHPDYERDPEWRLKDSNKKKRQGSKRPVESLNREESYPEDEFDQRK